MAHPLTILHKICRIFIWNICLFAQACVWPVALVIINARGFLNNCADGSFHCFICTDVTLAEHFVQKYNQNSFLLLAFWTNIALESTEWVWNVKNWKQKQHLYHCQSFRFSNPMYVSVCCWHLWKCSHDNGSSNQPQGISPHYWQHESCYELLLQSKHRPTPAELDRNHTVAPSILVVRSDSLDRCSSSEVTTGPVGTWLYTATHPLDSHHRADLEDCLWEMDPIMVFPFKHQMSHMWWLPAAVPTMCWNWEITKNGESLRTLCCLFKVFLHTQSNSLTFLQNITALKKKYNQVSVWKPSNVPE